jgi:peptidoglycan/xylan/chitin deacetylase (PgdA/CDA1 family)
MITAYHPRGKVFWPDRCRIAVFLSFDFQGGEFVVPLPNGKMNLEDLAQAEYGPSTGIWRILRILKERGVKATFLTCGGIAERYPEAMQAIAADGHEVAGHGYHHEVARDLSREQESDVCKRTAEMLQLRTGKRPVGWRTCTQSPNTLEILLEQRYLWNSNSFQYDLPFVWESSGRTLIELPRQPYGDGWIYGGLNTAGDPIVALRVWKALFDELYQESAAAPSYCPFVMHPFISSRPGKAKVMADMIEYMQSHEGVWFATGSEVAEWWLTQNFSQVPLPRVSARAAGGARA